MEAQTLMLDQSYAPIKVIPWWRAVQLMFLGKCEVIEEYEDEVRSTKLVIKVPAVVRLLRGFRRHHKPVKFSRVNIYARDNYECQYCGVKQALGELTYDHVVPRSRGGKTDWDNIATCCQKCNAKKSNRTPSEAKMKLRKEPKQPKAVPAIVIEVSRANAPAAWRDYLYWTGELEHD